MSDGRDHWSCCQMMSIAEETQQWLWTGSLALAGNKIERHTFQLPGGRKGGLSNTPLPWATVTLPVFYPLWERKSLWSGDGREGKQPEAWNPKGWQEERVVVLMTMTKTISRTILPLQVGVMKGKGGNQRKDSHAEILLWKWHCCQTQKTVSHPE